MRICVYLNESNEELLSLDGLSANPLEVGDELKVLINEPTPNSLHNLPSRIKELLIEKHNKITYELKHKTIILTKEVKLVRFNFNESDELIIEYFAEIIDG